MRHGDHLVHVMLLTDPLTLTEPLIKSQDFVLRVQNGQTWVYPCESVVEIPRPRGTVPHFSRAKIPSSTNSQINSRFRWLQRSAAPKRPIRNIR